MSTEWGLEKSILNQRGVNLFKEFLPFFVGTPGGSLLPQNVRLEFTPRLKQKLGLSLVFDRIIRLNFGYFVQYPERLPYTLFHELTHLWLYDRLMDPAHTEGFFQKMDDFTSTGYLVDTQVHNSRKIVKDAPFIYVCPRCSNRWHLHETASYSIYCGQCFDRLGTQFKLTPVPRDQLSIKSNCIGQAA